jgi:hypothetical protein
MGKEIAMPIKKFFEMLRGLVLALGLGSLTLALVVWPGVLVWVYVDMVSFGNKLGVSLLSLAGYWLLCVFGSFVYSYLTES